MKAVKKSKKTRGNSIDQEAATQMMFAEKMRVEAMVAGAYFWFRAQGPEENMVSAMNRMRYHSMAKQLDALGIPRPTREAMYGHAASLWPPDKLHAWEN